MCGFVEGFLDTPVGPVPRVRMRVNAADRLGDALARLGSLRREYTVVPGLYCVGSPRPDSPVLATANYKLTFDALRSRLEGVDAWLLVLDTRGINVWCAAGKALFSTAETVRMVRLSRLDEVVSHRRLVLPQLCATGVDGLAVRRECGFQVVWGPVRADDVAAFLADGMQASEPMRRVTFTLGERAVLTPVELYLAGRPLAVALALAVVLSGIGPEVWSPSMAWERGVRAVWALLAGVAAGAVAVPLALPWLPGRSLALKGIWAGAAVACLAPFAGARGLDLAGMALMTVAVASYMAMNFTGSTPYTSPSGVEKEMRRFLPVQISTALAGMIVWVGSAFWRLP